MSAALARSSRRTRERLRRFRDEPLGIASAVLLLLILTAAAAAPLLTSVDPNSTNLAEVLVGPSVAHPLGTDSAGRDVWSRLLFGGRTSFAAAAVALATAALLGIPSGLIAGYLGGRIDAAFTWIATITLAAPSIIILLAARAAVGTSMVITMTVLGALISPAFYRLVRSLVRGVREELYVDAARIAGLGDAAIIRRHVLVAVRAPLIIQGVEIAGVAISVQAGLEFLGLGDPLVPNWGLMLNEGFRNVYLAPLLLLWPAGAIVLTVVALALLGNALRDALAPAAPRPAKRGRASGFTAPAVESCDDEVVDIRDFSIGYAGDGTDTVVVSGVDLRVGAGEIVGLVGESGSGKTQLALSVLGLLPRQAQVRGGSVVVTGTQLVDAASGRLSDTAARPLRGRNVGYIPQEPMSNLDPNTRIGDQLARPLRRVLGLDRAQARERVLELLRSVGLGDAERVARSYSWQISGGMAQRVLIAAALGGRPRLLVADEPTTALDVSVQADILDLLAELREQTGAAILLVTHDFGVVADLCDRVVVLQHGRVVEEGSTRTILNDPQHPYTRSLLSAHLAGREPLTTIGLDGDTPVRTERTSTEEARA